MLVVLTPPKAPPGRKTGDVFLPIGYYELDPAAATPNVYRVLEYYTVRFKIIVYYY